MSRTNNNQNEISEISEIKMSSREVQPKVHNHTMVYAGIDRNDCEITTIYMCSDQECGHWTSSTSHDSSGCNMQVTRFSTRVTCNECSKCGRKTVDHS